MKTHLSKGWYCTPDGGGYSTDKRKRRRQHRRAARRFATEGGGGTFRAMKWWHLQQAKCLTYAGRM